MKLKKLAAITLGMTMVLSIPAYANDADAMAVYQEMEAVSSTMTDTDSYSDFLMTMKSDENTMKMRIEMNTKATGLTTPEQLKMNTFMRMTMVDLGSMAEGMEGVSLEDFAITSNMYYENGMYYTDMLGMKTKKPMPLDQIMQSTKGLMGASSDYLQNMKLRKEGEDRILSFTMDASKMNDLVAQVLGAGGMASADPDSASNIAYRDMSGEYIINPQGYCTKAKMNLTMDMISEGTPYSVTLVGDIGYADPGAPVTITTPNLAEYTEAETE